MSVKRSIIFTVVLSFFLINSLSAQFTERKWSLNGHLQTLNNVWVPPSSGQWQTMTSLTNRLDFRWYPSRSFSLHIGGRNIMNLGQMVQANYPYYAEIATMETGFLELTKQWISDSSYFIYSNVDRANVKFIAGKFEITAGRQRINWGVNMVWNPNDIFNTFNYFDFDYVERPGCDAVHMQYYTGSTSSLQFAFKLDNDKDITTALMYKFNKWNYDFQFFGGLMEQDLVAGAGWSGDIEGAGFTGELSYFLDKDKNVDTNGVFVGSIGLNYTFSNSLYIAGSYLYNSAGTTGPAGYGTVFTLFLDINAKTFTRARHSVFAQASYPITPLIKVDAAAIFNPNDKSGFFGPSVDFSLTSNISLFLISQIFWGDPLTEFGDYGTLTYLRLKWSF